jgi:hypothetical protein
MASSAQTSSWILAGGQRGMERVFFAVILMLVELDLEDFGENFDGFLGNVFHEILTNNFIFMGGFFSGWVILVQLRSRAGPGFCSS